MMEWTDRHCRFFHRLLAPHARLYTEMLHANAVNYGDETHLLGYSPREHALALQLGGSDPIELANAARIGQRWGYDEININCGCPSDRVLQGAFGACLMGRPKVVRACVEAMLSVVDIPVTVKHRVGLDEQESYGFVCDFVGEVALGGCEVFIVHARGAWMKGLSPAENREIPPLHYDWAYQLKRDFPQLTFVLNGGITSVEQAQQHLQQVDGVMLGRAAYRTPLVLRELERALFNPALPSLLTEPARFALEQELASYTRQIDLPYCSALTRHLLGLYKSTPGGKAWRRAISDAHVPGHDFDRLLLKARQARLLALQSSLDSASEPSIAQQ